MLLIGAAALFLLFLFPNILLGQTGVMFETAADFIISNEGFIPVSRWDYKQYTWGYGTAAPGAGMRISEQQARDEMMKRIDADYQYLASLLSIPLNTNQWAALLDFSYNEGRANADNLVQNINNQDWEALAAQMRLYTLAGGVRSDNLADRREKEIQLFFS